MLKCRICGARLATPPGRLGRRPSYCGVPCRRAAEREIARVDELLGALEAEAAQWRASGVPGVFGFDPARHAAEIDRQRARLRELLAAGEPAAE